jgi:cytochrome c-type biogenesis protein
MALSIFIAFVAGIVSFISPCILPLIPGFMAYLSQTAETDGSARARTFINSIFFVLGFSSVFALLGVLLNTVLARSSFAVQTWLSRIAGLIIIFFALHILGLIKIRFLQSDHKLKAKRFKSSYLTSYVFGASFAVGWTPCVGAILGSIFALAVANPVNSFVLLLAYAIGLGLPFLIVGIFTEQAMAFIGKSEKILRYFNIIVGILLLVLGILVFTNNLTSIASFIVPQGFIS